MTIKALASEIQTSVDRLIRNLLTQASANRLMIL